jgi:N6-L-threonylcarbamoyladenine synthase
VSCLNRSSDKILCLGLDTSAYTTSLALVDQDEKLIYDRRIALPVKEGQLGLRQSEAVFEHIRNMPLLWSECQAEFQPDAIRAISVSDRPRPLEKSYMPVFKVGEAFGLFLAQTMGLKYFSSSHQEGHIMAGLWSADADTGPYLVVQISGGTTEIVAAEEHSCGWLRIELVGGAADLNAGQFVDRIGQKINLPFPAGPHLEVLATKAEGDLPRLPLAVKDAAISFSGPASEAERLLERGCRPENLARAVEICIADSISAAVAYAWDEEKNYAGLLVVGGVSANSLIRNRICSFFRGKSVYFAESSYGGDNAVGQAIIASRRLQQQKGVA